MLKKIFLTTFLLIFSFSLEAKVKIITTTTNLADISLQIGGDKVSIQSLCRGTQDPHYLEAKPSYTFKLSKADLLISIGAGLEVGWLPLVVRGSRNPDLRVGQKSRLVASKAIKMLEVKTGKLSRADGDVHPEGNPHFLLSPLKSIEVAQAITEKLKSLDPKNAGFYSKNNQKYKSKIQSLMTQWKKKLSKGIKVVSYHKTLSYFYHDFGVENVNVLEPKPGVPPTASHILKVIAQLKKMKIQKIIVENYFDDTVAKRVQKEVPGAKIKVVAVAVSGDKNISNIFDLYEQLVKSLEP